MYDVLRRRTALSRKAHNSFDSSLSTEKHRRACIPVSKNEPQWVIIECSYLHPALEFWVQLSMSKLYLDSPQLWPISLTNLNSLGLNSLLNVDIGLGKHEYITTGVTILYLMLESREQNSTSVYTVHTEWAISFTPKCW